LEVATTTLQDLIGRHDSLSPAAIIAVVADFYDLTVEDLQCDSRRKEVSLPRQVAMYLIRQETEASLPQIGQQLGGRDHTTVLHACNKITSLVEEDNQLRRDVLSIRERLYRTVKV
jgi:chromosomal replication initiator protein